MKKTIKDLYNIDATALIKYSNNVYKIKDSENSTYCLKYIDNSINNNIIEKINILNLNQCFQMPIKTCIRSNVVRYNDKSFTVSKWVDDDYVESKDLKIKYYLNQIGKLHNETSYTLNVTLSYFNEITLKIEEDIQYCYHQYEKIIENIERLEYKSPFQWYFIDNFKEIVASLDKSSKHLEKFKTLVKNKSVIRQTINHLNFSYDHVFISKDKIIGNDKMKQNSPIYDLVDLFDKIEYGSIDLSGMMDEYFKNFSLEEYEIEWLLTLLFILKPIELVNSEMKNIHSLMKILFKYKSVLELESKLSSK